MLARAGTTSSLGRRAVRGIAVIERWGDGKEAGAGEWLEQWRFSVVIGFRFYLLIHQFFDLDDFLGVQVRIL